MTAGTLDPDAALELADILIVELRLRLAAWREGYAAGERAHADDYERGFADGLMSLKRAQHDAHRLVELEMARWGGWREDFGRPREGDYAGGPVSWRRMEGAA